MIKIGQKVKFDPLRDISIMGVLDRRTAKFDKVVGTITYINVPHRWFSVEYGDKKKGYHLRTSFKFDDYGTKVTEVHERGMKACCS